MYLFPYLLPILCSSLTSASPSPSLLPRKDFGINCYGSGLCHGQDVWWQPIPKFLDIAVEAVKPTGTLLYGNSTMYKRDQHIMCRGHDIVFGSTCVFLEGEHVPEHGVPMQIVIERLAMLNDYECKICGSVPLSLDDNPRRYGMLKVNYVRDPKCGVYSLCIAVTKQGWVRGAIEGPKDQPGTPEAIQGLEKEFASEWWPYLEEGPDDVTRSPQLQD